MSLAMGVLIVALILVAVAMGVFLVTRYPKPRAERGGTMSMVAVAAGLLIVPIVIGVYYWGVTWDAW